MKDFYKILEVHRESSQTEIKLSFRGLIKKYHPDANANSNNFTEIIQDINEAYDTLKDNSKRHAYNLMYDKHYKSNQQKQSPKQEPKNINEYVWHGLNTEKYELYSSEYFEKFKNRVISNFQKDEFETKKEFKRRIREIESEVFNSYWGKQNIVMKYDADNTLFEVTLNKGLNFKVSVPRNIAPDFKSSIKRFTVRCSKALKIIDISTEFRGVNYIGSDFKEDWILSTERERNRRVSERKRKRREMERKDESFMNMLFDIM